jgi:hypothetical protein
MAHAQRWWGMSAATVIVDQGRPHDAEELPTVLAQSILSAPRAAAKLSEACWLVVRCPVSNRIRRDVRTVDDGLKEAPERRVAVRVIWLTGVVRPPFRPRRQNSGSLGCVRSGIVPESGLVNRLSGRITGRRSRFTPRGIAACSISSIAVTYNQLSSWPIDTDQVGNAEYRSHHRRRPCPRKNRSSLSP